MTWSLPRLLTITFTTAAFGRSSLWLFEVSPYSAAPKGEPSSLVQHVKTHRINGGVTERGASYSPRMGARLAPVRLDTHHEAVKADISEMSLPTSLIGHDLAKSPRPSG
jgi:hypothetical protein